MDPEITKIILSIVSDALKILGPAIVTGVVAFKTGKSQHILKLKELDKNNEFKAREKIFAYHREKIEENKVAVGHLGNELGQISGMLLGGGEEDADLSEFMNGYISVYLDKLPFDMALVKKEMELYPKEFEEEKVKIRKLSESIEGLKKPTDARSIHHVVTELLRTYHFLGHCIRLLIEKEAMEVFRPYVGNA